MIYALPRYNMDWIANTGIGLDPNNSVIKRLWCIHSKNSTNMAKKQTLCSYVLKECCPSWAKQPDRDRNQLPPRPKSIKGTTNYHTQNKHMDFHLSDRWKSMCSPQTQQSAPPRRTRGGAKSQPDRDRNTPPTPVNAPLIFGYIIAHAW